MKNIAVFKLLLIINFSLFILGGCSIQKQISKSATRLVLKDSSLATAHVGISIYEPATNKYWFNYQGDHYFVPASNTKIPTCYAAMKYLGDSLVGLSVAEYEDFILFSGTGDPTFLHEDFKIQPIYNYLKSLDKSAKVLLLTSSGWQEKGLGSGWAWNDYDADYMAERSAFPIYGNVVSMSGKTGSINVRPGYFLPFSDLTHSNAGGYLNRGERSQFANEFRGFSLGNSLRIVKIPFITSDSLSLILLHDTLKLNHQKMGIYSTPIDIDALKNPVKFNLHSQPTDSLLKPMMHRSDNFFAEQTLLMVSNERLGVMNDEKIIDTLLKTDFKDLPQKPRWADGSGLSRYNLFTPQDFVAIFNKMKNEFGMDRIKNIFPTGNEGTLNNYYKAENGYLFGKTGSLSGVVALSGFLYTKKNKLLIFSVLVNNHNASATGVRRAVEKFIENLREKY
jgi:D-alanyl-D-alanine carboxypeptidase/D-alanyl-D-alanine-endopeptidase (penicillin-binding protein 4)